MKLAEKKYEILIKRNLEPKELKYKLSTYLYSKGFDYELIKEVGDKILKEQSD
jgi:SOS response regulatory protein OraA/RecX